MKELKIEDKQKYLNDNYPFAGVPKLTDKKRCIHCDSVFVVGDYKVYKDESKEDFEYICCPNAPDCDGTIIDWFDLD
jgi:hypothetical protein